LDLGEDVSVEIKIELGLLRADDFCEVLPAQFVTVLKFAIVVSFLLDCIVRQVDQLVSHIVECVLPATCADIAILIAIAFQTAINACQQSEAPEVKLALMNQ